MPDRPNPLNEVASKVGAAWSAIAGLVGALVAFGVLTAAQGQAITAVGEVAPTVVTALGTLVAGLMPLIGGLVASFRTVKVGREYVTPISDPATVVTDSMGNKRLVALVSASDEWTERD